MNTPEVALGIGFNPRMANPFQAEQPPALQSGGVEGFAQIYDEPIGVGQQVTGAPNMLDRLMRNRRVDLSSGHRFARAAGAMLLAGGTTFLLGEGSARANTCTPTGSIYKIHIVDTIALGSDYANLKNFGWELDENGFVESGPSVNSDARGSVTITPDDFNERGSGSGTITVYGHNSKTGVYGPIGGNTVSWTCAAPKPTPKPTPKPSPKPSHGPTATHPIPGPTSTALQSHPNSSKVVTSVSSQESSTSAKATATSSAEQSAASSSVSPNTQPSDTTVSTSGSGATSSAAAEVAKTNSESSGANPAAVGGIVLGSLVVAGAGSYWWRRQRGVHRS